MYRIDLLCIMMLSLFLTGCQKQHTQIRWETESESMASETENCEKETISIQTAEETERQHLIYVDVCGAVNEPGVYVLEEPARVFEAIERAGGLTAFADRRLLNQAEVLTDGTKLYVYTVEEAENLQIQREDMVLTETQSRVSQTDDYININTADMQSLMTLSGIGESRAKDIISYREEHGRFTVVEEIMNVSGIKESTFNKIKDKIVVD